MRKVTLGAFMAGSMIPPLVFCQLGQVAELVNRGLTAGEIAQDLAVSLALGVAFTFLSWAAFRIA